MSEEIIEKRTVKGKDEKFLSVNERIQVVRFWARFIIAITTMSIFLYIVHMMLTTSSELTSSSKDLMNILIGAFIPILSGIAKFYFDSGDDMEAHPKDPKKAEEEK